MCGLSGCEAVAILTPAASLNNLISVLDVFFLSARDRGVTDDNLVGVYKTMDHLSQNLSL